MEKWINYKDWDVHQKWIEDRKRELILWTNKEGMLRFNESMKKFASEITEDESIKK